MRHIVIILVSIGLLNFWFYDATTFADTTEVLRPLTDGVDDSLWANTVGTLCNTADCYLEVDESSGSFCNNSSDGDASFITASANGAVQTFDVDESTIPDNSTINQIDITVCQIRVGTAPPNNFQTRMCVDSTCANSGVGIGGAANYTVSTQSHTNIAITKSRNTNIQIGVFITGTKDKNVRISRISAVVHYSPPPGGGGGGGGNWPARIIFSGKAFPGATLGIYLMGEQYGQILIDGEFKTSDDGSFKKEIVSPVEEKRLYGLLVKDREGNPAKSKFFNYDLKHNAIIKQENIIIAPTISISQSSLARGEVVFVSGYGAPGNKIEALVDGIVRSSIEVSKDGSYGLFVNTSDLTPGNHKVQTRQIDPISKTISDLSETKIIRVASFYFFDIDYNSDNKIDIQDWSIFLHRWSSNDEKIRKKNDLNGDDKINVSDFSIFLLSFQLRRR